MASTPSVYTTEEAIKEIESTMAFEGMYLTEEDRKMLLDMRSGKVSGDMLRQKILSEVK